MSYRERDEREKGGTVMEMIFWAVGGIAGLYGLHRLALRLEAAGHLYYLRKKPSGGVGNCFLAVQQIAQPGARNVLIVGEEAEEGEGSGAPPHPAWAARPERPGEEPAGGCGA